MDFYTLLFAVAVASLISSAIVTAVSRRQDNHADESAVETLTETMLKLSAQIRTLEAEYAMSRGKIRQLEERVYKAVRLISILTDGLQDLSQQIVDMDAVPVWEPPSDAEILLEEESKPRGSKREPKVLIWQQLGEYFEPDELRELAGELGVNYNYLPGTQHRARAQSLVEHMYNRGRLPELVEKADQLRPLLEWPDVY